jgi:hypothetical protein
MPLLSVAYRVNRPISDITFGVILFGTSDQLVVDGRLQFEGTGPRWPANGARFGVDFHLHAHLLRGQYTECRLPQSDAPLSGRVGPVGSLTVMRSNVRGGIADLAVVPVVRPSPHPTASAISPAEPVGITGGASRSA